MSRTSLHSCDRSIDFRRDDVCAAELGRLTRGRGVGWAAPGARFSLSSASCLVRDGEEERGAVSGNILMKEMDCVKTILVELFRVSSVWNNLWGASCALPSKISPDIQLFVGVRVHGE